MKRARTAALRPAAVGHFLTTLLLLLVSALLPLAPLVDAWSLANQACQCCDKPGAKCCRRSHHWGTSHGPAWTAGIPCGSSCGYPGGATPAARLTAVLPAGRDLPALAALAETLFFFDTPTAGASSLAWLYQRPPPVRA